MLKWIRNYYVGEDVKNPGRARARIIVGQFVHLLWGSPMAGTEQSGWFRRSLKKSTGKQVI